MFIDTSVASFQYKVTEGDLQPRLADLLTNVAGWHGGKNGTSVAAYFKKVVFAGWMTNPSVPKIPGNTASIAVAEHFIYKNNDDKMIGLAIVGSWQQLYGDLGKKPDTDGLDQFAVWATNQFRRYRKVNTIYFYMIEDLKGLDQLTQDIVIAWKDNYSSESSFLHYLENASLDVEVVQTAWKNYVGSYNLIVTEAYPERMQSPIIPASLRLPSLETFFDTTIHSDVKYTNWWYDSNISFIGNADDKGLFFIVQCDNVPAFENNAVVSIPLYFGPLDSVEQGDNPYALFAGSVPLSADYDYDDPNQRTQPIMPIMKNYPANPANGIDSIMVSRSKLGARYQSYYLAWQTPSNLILPTRSVSLGSGKALDYPRAWNNFNSDVYRYQFNPSRYSNKVHASKLYVVHPEEGVRGTLKNAIAFSAVSFHAKKIRVKQASCPDKFDVYRYFLIDGLSPLTKRPGTPYRPAGLGIYSETVDNQGNPVT